MTKQLCSVPRSWHRKSPFPVVRECVPNSFIEALLPQQEQPEVQLRSAGLDELRFEDDETEENAEN